MGAANFAATQLFRAIPRVRLSRIVGRLCDQPLPPVVSRAVERAFVRAYRVDIAEAAPRAEAYPSFDAFFTRPLKDGARVVHSDDLVSAADGLLRATGKIQDGGCIQVKGNTYSVAELLGSASDAAAFRSGSFAVTYLSPRDYHRVHSPVDGRITRVRSIPGDLFPVNSIGERIPRLYVRNSRVAIHVETASLGLVTVVMVGAIFVGRISVKAVPGLRASPQLHELRPAVEVVKGDEIGMFHLGSSVVVLVQTDRTFVESGRRVRYGESLLRTS